MKTFKLLNLLLLALVLATTLYSCGKDGDEDDSNLTSTTYVKETGGNNYFTEGMNFSSSAADEQKLNFRTNADWTISGANAWCTLSSERGKKGAHSVVIAVAENTGHDDRNVTLTFRAGTATETIVVTQKQKDALTLTTNKFEVEQSGGTVNIEVKANISYEVVIGEACKEWISQASTRTLTTSTVTLNIAACEESDKREGEVTIKSGELTETVYIYQTGGSILVLTKNNYTVSGAGETIAVEIKSNIEYGVQMPKVDWISENTTRAVSSYTLYYAIASNEGYDNRSAQIVFYDKNNESKTETLTITQAQKNAIILSQSEYAVAAEGGSIEIKLNANVDFEIEMPAVEWISKAPETRGLTERKVSFIVSENEVKESRSAEIVFVNKDKNVRDVVTVVQEASTGIKTVTVESAGTLSNYVTNKETALKINGPLNGTDIKHLRSMSATLVYLDLSEASIVTGGDYYYYDTLNGYFFSHNNKISKYMFCKMSVIETIILPNGVTTIETFAFWASRRLTSVTMSNNVTSIGTFAFSSCVALANVVMSNKLVRIEPGSFSGCSALTNITIPNSVISIGESAFFGCISLIDITIPNSVTKIDDSAFKDCLALTSVTIPDSVTSLGRSVFCNCRSLKNVDANYIGEIRYSIFENCISLENITIGENITEIGTGSFNNCDNIEEIHMKSLSPPRFDYEDSFTQTCYSNCTLYVPKGSKEKYSASNWSRFKNIVEE